MANERETRRDAVAQRRGPFGLRAALRHLLALVVLSSGALCTADVAAWSRACGWSVGTGLTSINTFVHCSSFESLGYDCSNVTRLVTLAQLPWNETGGTRLRLNAPTTTTQWGPRITNAVLYRMDESHSNPAIRGQYLGDCQGGLVTLYANHAWSTEHPVASGNFSMLGRLIHETGHALGLNDAESTPGVTCGGVPNTTTRAAMSALPTRTDYDALMIFRDDWTALRSGACAYPAAVPAGTATVRRGTAAGMAVTWADDSSWPAPGGTNLTPGIVSAADGSGSYRIEALVDQNNALKIRRRNVSAGTYNGALNDPLVGAKALAGPALAWNGTNKLLLVYPTFDAGSEGRIRILESTNHGASWSGRETAFFTNHRVGVTWSSSHNRFFIVFAEGPTPGIGGTGPCANCGRLTVFSTTGGPGATDTLVYPGTAPPNTHICAAGPAVACPLYPRCWFVCPDLDVSPNTLRQQVLSIDPATGAVAETNRSPFPVWTDSAGASRYIASTRDVSADYDAMRGAIVYAFREQVPSTSSLDAVWFLAVDDAAPPGFASDSDWDLAPDDPFGFLPPSGQAAASILSAGAITFDELPSPAIAYVIAHR